MGHDPVLARAEEESSQLLDDSPVLLDHLERAGRHGPVTEQARLPRRIGMEESPRSRGTPFVPTSRISGRESKACSPRSTRSSKRLKG
jgi:hypothetical protein